MDEQSAKILIINLDKRPQLIYNWVFKKGQQAVSLFGHALDRNEIQSGNAARDLSVVGAGEHDSLGFVRKVEFRGAVDVFPLPSLVTVIANREARAGSM